MGRHQKKQRQLPKITASTDVVDDLLILAGLPHPLHTHGETQLQNIAGARSKVIAVPSPSFDGLLYRQRTIQKLLTSTAHFTIRHLKTRSDNQSVRPRRMALFYVPAEDDQELLGAFDFFVFPVPLRDLASFNAGKQERHQSAAYEQALRRGMAIYFETFVSNLQRKIDSRRSCEPLLLPPVNFHLRDGRLKDVFCELTRGSRAWENAMPDGMASEFDYQRLPAFLRAQERQTIFRDARDVVFPCARPTELHGVHEVDRDAEVGVLRELLRSTYRFGASLPQGFHHDAQLESGRQFNQTRFDCSRNGALLVTGSHVNVYPNDFVRVAE